MSPKVSIIILNWNGRDDTLACLAPLHQIDYTAYEIVVVDNGSTDDSVAAIRTSYPQVTLIETGHNLGYVGGNNVGLEYANATHADYALLLNNDTEVAPDFLSLLVDAAETDPKIGIVGPTIYYHTEPERIWSAGGAIDWARGSTWMVGLNEIDRGQFGGAPRPVDFVTGCALLIKMPVVAQMGLLDPRFFAYYEETEWCVRVARAGFKILHVPQAKLWHKISLVARGTSLTVYYYMTRNRLIFLSAARAGLRAWLNTLILEYLRTFISWSVQPKWRGQQGHCKIMVRAVSDYFAGRFGQASL